MGDRQLNELEYNRLRVDSAVALSTGYLWSYNWSVTLAAGGSENMSWTVIPERACRGFQLGFSTTGARGAHFEFFFGGDVQGPTPLQGYPLNHETPRPEPFSQIGHSGVIATPGTKIGEFSMDTDGFLSREIFVIFAPGQSYYMLATNLDNQTASITLDMDATSIPGAL